LPLSLTTQQIVDALRQLAEEYSFGFATEARYFPWLGAHSERVDAEFLLPTGQPALRFEIDNEPDRAAHNRLKIFGNVYSLSTLPVVALSVLHGSASTQGHSYPAELLEQGFVTPPRFLDELNVDNSSTAAITSQLHDWFNQLIEALAKSPEGETVFDIAEQYQPLVANVSLAVATAHLHMHSELAWFLAAQHYVNVDRAASLSVALARMMQRAGMHRDASRVLATIRERLPGTSALSSQTEDDARTVEFLLTTPALDSGHALAHLSEAVGGVRAHYHRSKFHWRKGIVEVLAGNAFRAEDILRSYLADMDGSRIALSNAALVRTIGALSSGQGDPREHAAAYAKHEQSLLFLDDSQPDGTVHGVVACLYLRAIAEISCGNRAASHLLAKLDAFRHNAGIPRTADGLREIAYFLPPTSDSRTLTEGSSGSLASLMSHGRKAALWRLCTETNDVCGP
jgi:hypothetical protein